MGTETVDNFSEKVSFIWSVADLLRGDYKQSEYGKVILPLVVLRRLDCVLAPTKEEVLAEHAKHRGKVDNVDPILERITGHKGLFNTSKFDLPKLLGGCRGLRSVVLGLGGGGGSGWRVWLYGPSGFVPVVVGIGPVLSHRLRA